MEQSISPITTALINSAAGTLGGIASFSLFYPLENFRTRLQARQTTPKPLHHVGETISNVGDVVDGIKKDAFDVFEEKLSQTKDLLDPKRSKNDSLIQKLLHKLREIYTEILSTLQFGRNIYNKHGISGFYQGLGVGVFGIGVSNAIYMYWYQLLKDLMLQFRSTLRSLYTKSRRRQRTALSPLDNIIVASLAGVVNITITNPIWVVNLRQTLRDNNTSTTTPQLDSAAQSAPTIKPALSMSYIKSLWVRLIAWLKSTEIYKLVETEGFQGLYKGYSASLVLVLNPTIQYVLYDQLVARFQQGGKDGNPKELTSTHFFLISALSKALSTIVTFPYLVVKTRLQQDQKTVTQRVADKVKDVTKECLGVGISDVSSGARSDDSISPNQVDQTDIITEVKRIKSQEEAIGLYQTMVKMYEEEGYGVFFKGITPKLIQTVSNAALTTVLHEKIKDYMMDIAMANIQAAPSTQ